jgi:serine/threonine protein phosphatase PrpC
LPVSGYLLICSDGLWGVISEEDIARAITMASSPQQASKALIEAANLAGGPDNISVIVVQLPTQ